MTRRGHSGFGTAPVVDSSEAAYERLHGPIPSNGAFLQLVLGHPSFAWLRDLSRSMAHLDELAEAKEASLRRSASRSCGVAPGTPGAHGRMERNSTGGITTRLNGTRTRRSRMPRSWN